MRSPIIAVLFALSAVSAAAQCVAQAPAAMSVTPPAAVSTPHSGELIASAVAATHDDIMTMRTAPTHTTPARGKPSAANYSDDGSDHDTGAAMLFAAVALMSGIALRRYTAPRP